MYSSNPKSLLSYSEKLYDEMYSLDVLINATKCCCQEKEFCGEYYGIPKNFIHKISNERNEYLSLLAVISEKVKHVIKLNKIIEKELTLH